MVRLQGVETPLLVDNHQAKVGGEVLFPDRPTASPSRSSFASPWLVAIVGMLVIVAGEGAGWRAPAARATHSPSPLI